MAGPENNTLTRNWLVKSSTKILGPFTREEVLDLLTRRQITIIDEIRQPEGRWNYIRENRHFKEIVKNLRYEDDHSREDTMTSTMTSTATHGSKTENSFELDSAITPVVPPKAPPQNATTSKIKDVTPTREPGTHAAKNSGPAKSFGNLQDQRVQSKIQKQNVFLRSLLFGITGCAVAFLIFNYVRKDKSADLGYSQLLSSALRYKELGLYERSLESYKRAAALKEPDLDSQFQMAFLLINQDRQSLNGRRIIERASLKEGRSRQDVIQSHLGIALSYMMEGDFTQAESHFQKALSFDGNNPAAKFNQATISFKKGIYGQALKGYEALSNQASPLYPLVLLYRSMAMIELKKAPVAGEEISEDASKKLGQEIKSFTQTSHFLRKELSLMRAYLHHLSGDMDGKQDGLRIFLEEPYNFSSLFVKDPTLDWRNAEWDYLEKYCADLYNADPASANIKPVRAACLLESNRDMEATKYIDEALASNPKGLSSLQAQAIYLSKLGRVNEAKLLLQNLDLEQNRLVLYIYGEACSKAKDASCAEKAYHLLEKIDSKDVVPPYGLARLKAEQKDKIKALSFVKTGFEREKNFIPLIELREKLESL